MRTGRECQGGGPGEKKAGKGVLLELSENYSIFPNSWRVEVKAQKGQRCGSLRYSKSVAVLNKGQRGQMGQKRGTDGTEVFYE